MKRASRAAALLILIGIITAFTVTQFMPVYPPVRVGKSTYRAHGSKIYNFVMTQEEAEVIAHIKIGDWLGGR